MMYKLQKLRKCEDEPNKKAVSPILSWVLLLGLSVSIGVGVFLWQTRQTEQLGNDVVKFASGVMDCENLNFNIQSSDGCTNLTIKNSGFFNIDGFVVRSFSTFGTGTEIKETFIQVQHYDTLDVGVIAADKVQVIPLVKVKNDIVGCTDRIKEVSCTGLDDIQGEACNTADAQGSCSLLASSGIVACKECCDYLEQCCGC